MVVQRLPYKRSLRVLGRYLDEVDAADATVLDTGTGMLIRYHQRPDWANVATELLTWSIITALDQRYAQDRVRILRQPSAEPGIFPAEGREEYFRALGHELDRDGAEALVLDEQPDGISYSYHHSAQRRPGNPEKCAVFTRTADIQLFASRARNRRQRRAS